DGWPAGDRRPDRSGRASLEPPSQSPASPPRATAGNAAGSAPGHPSQLALCRGLEGGLGSARPALAAPAPGSGTRLATPQRQPTASPGSASGSAASRDQGGEDFLCHDHAPREAPGSPEYGSRRRPTTQTRALAAAGDAPLRRAPGTAHDRTGGTGRRG